jgi:DNA anti-recombination protein RmuC
MGWVVAQLYCLGPVCVLQALRWRSEAARSAAELKRLSAALEESERRVQDAQRSSAYKLAEVNQQLQEALQRVAALEAERATATEASQSRQAVQVGDATWCVYEQVEQLSPC